VTWERVTWQGGPHDGLCQRFRGGALRPWRSCQCHGAQYRYVGVVNGIHRLVIATNPERISNPVEVEA